MLHTISAADAAKINSNNRRTFRSRNASGGSVRARFLRGFCILVSAPWPVASSPSAGFATHRAALWDGLHSVPPHPGPLPWGE